MKTKIVIESHIEELANDVWMELADKEGYIPKTEQEKKEILAELGIGEDAYTMISGAFDYAREQIVEHLHKDLEDIWKRLDAIEGK